MQINILRGEQTDRLFQAILSLENVEECYQFFDDLCTISEVQSLAQRFEVAKMLQESKTYDEIQRETGASTATISRVRRFVDYGSDGYKLALERLSEEEK